MERRHAIVGRAELALILVMALGFLLIVQQWSFAAYQVGLLTVMAATVLNIAVGNLPRTAGPGRALGLTLCLSWRSSPRCSQPAFSWCRTWLSSGAEAWSSKLRPLHYRHARA